MPRIEWSGPWSNRPRPPKYSTGYPDKTLLYGSFSKLDNTIYQGEFLWTF